MTMHELGFTDDVAYVLDKNRKHFAGARLNGSNLYLIAIYSLGVSSHALEATLDTPCWNWAAQPGSARITTAGALNR